MGKFRGLETEEGWIQRRLVAIERNVNELSAARRLVTANTFDQFSLDVAFPDDNTYHEYAIRNTLVPVGFTLATVNIASSMQVNLIGSGSANIGCQSSVTGSTGGTQFGVGLANGKNGQGVLSVTSALNVQVPAVGGGVLRLAVNAFFVTFGGPMSLAISPGANAVRLSASIVFTRS